MLRLNIRHQLPQTDLRIQRGTLDRAVVVPARVSIKDEQARSNKWVTLANTTSNSYKSEYVAGRRTMLDYARERGQKGISDAQAATSKRTQIAWSRLDNGGKRGDDIAQQMRSEVFQDYEAEPVYSIEWTKGADVQVQQSHLTGTPDLGDVTATIETTSNADIRTTQGGVETYIKDQGFLRQWVTEDYYDIYA